MTNSPPAEKLVPPGTAIFGVAYGDGSCGGWQTNEANVRDGIKFWRAMGFDAALIRARMKTEALVEDVCGECFGQEAA